MHKAFRLSIFLSGILFFSGCAAVWLGVGAGIGIGTYKFVEGNLIREYPLTYARAWDASNTALTKLRISVTSSSNEGTKGSIEGVRQDGTKIIIKVRDKGQNVTSIGVRVGLFGDRVTARKIHDEIAASVGL